VKGIGFGFEKMDMIQDKILEMGGMFEILNQVKISSSISIFLILVYIIVFIVFFFVKA
jgi:hypothetical protein